MAKATGRLTRWRLRLSEFEFDIFRRIGIKHQAADALSPPQTKVENRTLLDNEVPVIIETQTLFACMQETEPTDFEFINELKDPFIPFIGDVRMTAGIKNSEKMEIRTLGEISTTHYTDEDCCVAFMSVEK